MKLEILQSSTESVKFTPPWTTNRPTIPSSATVTILDSGGTTLQASVAVTAIDATTGEMSFSLNTTQTANLFENCVAKWDYVVSSVHYKETTLFDIVLHRLSQLATDEDIYAFQGDLRAKNENVQGAPTSAAAGTLVDTNVLKNYADDYFNNGIVEAMNPATGAVQRRVVSDFVQSTGTLSVTPNWATTPDTTYRYIVYKPFRVKLDAAWEMLMQDVRAKGFRPALIMNSADLKQVHTFKTLELICMDFMKTGAIDDLWLVLSEKYAQRYMQTFGNIKFQYDADESGLIDPSNNEKDRNAGDLKFVR